MVWPGSVLTNGKRPKNEFLISLYSRQFFITSYLAAYNHAIRASGIHYYNLSRTSCCSVLLCITEVFLTCRPQNNPPSSKQLKWKRSKLFVFVKDEILSTAGSHWRSFILISIYLQDGKFKCCAALKNWKETKTALKNCILLQGRLSLIVMSGCKLKISTMTGFSLWK